MLRIGIAFRNPLQTSQRAFSIGRRNLALFQRAIEHGFDRVKLARGAHRIRTRRGEHFCAQRALVDVVAQDTHHELAHDVAVVEVQGDHTLERAIAGREQFSGAFGSVQAGHEAQRLVTFAAARVFRNAKGACGQLDAQLGAHRPLSFGIAPIAQHFVEVLRGSAGLGSHCLRWVGFQRRTRRDHNREKCSRERAKAARRTS